MLREYIIVFNDVTTGGEVPWGWLEIRQRATIHEYDDELDVVGEVGGLWFWFGGGGRTT